MAFLLDTSILSEFRKPRPHIAVIRWLERVEDGDLYVSALTLGEIAKGAELLRPRAPLRAHEIDVWLRLARDFFGDRIVGVDSEVALLWGRFCARIPNPPAVDALIAATAAVKGLTVASRNERDFVIFGSKLLNPFGLAEAGASSRFARV